MFKVDSASTQKVIFAIIIAHVVGVLASLQVAIVLVLLFWLLLKNDKILVISIFVTTLVLINIAYVNITDDVYKNKIFESKFTLVSFQNISQWSATVMFKENNLNKILSLSVSGESLQYVKSMRIGDEFLAKVQVQKYEYSKHLWAMAKHIGYKGKVLEVKKVIYQKPFNRFLPRVLDTTCLHYKKMGSLICNMIFVSDIKISKSLYKIYDDSGLQHIVIVSGSNLALFIMVINWILQKANFSIRKLNFINLGLCYYFAQVNGFEPSISRAAIMFATVSFLKCWYVKFDYFTVVAFAITLLTIVDPLIVFSRGFWLSTVCALALNINNSSSRLSWKASVICFIATAPILIYSNSFNLKSIFFNIVFVPIFSIFSTIFYIAVPLQSLIKINFYPIAMLFELVVNLLKQLT